MANTHMNLHDAYEVEIKGTKVKVDCGIIDLVLWLNKFPGIETFTSCQGGAACCRAEAFVGFTSVDPNMPKEIQKALGCGRLSQHNDSYELEFDVQELIAINQKHFAGSPSLKCASGNQASVTPKERCE